MHRIKDNQLGTSAYNFFHTNLRKFASACRWTLTAYQLLPLNPQTFRCQTTMCNGSAPMLKSGTCRGVRISQSTKGTRRLRGCTEGTGNTSNTRIHSCAPLVTEDRYADAQRFEPSTSELRSDRSFTRLLPLVQVKASNM